jgi:hypothetical protein
MVFDDRPEAILRALSPVTPAVMADNNPCAYLKGISSGEAATPLSPATFYHRYLHGQVSITAVALQWFDLAVVRQIYDACSFFVIALLILSNFILLARSLDRISTERASEIDSQRAGKHGCLLVTSCVLALFYGLQFYGMSLGHAPSDAVIYLYLLVVTLTNFSIVNFWLVLAIHALFGIFTAYFELFTGGLPLGVSMIFLSFAPLAVGPRRTETFWLACLSGGAFLTAFVVAVVTKLLVAGHFFGYAEVLNNFLNQLQFWGEGDRVGLIAAGVALAEASHYLGNGWRLAGVALLAFSGLAFVYSLVVLWSRLRSDGNWQYPALLVLAYVAIVAWYVVFRKHGYQHNFFMIRISVALIASSLLLLLAASRARLAVMLRSLATLADASTRLEPHRSQQTNPIEKK